MHILGIDIGGSYLKFGIINHNAEFIKTWHMPTPKTLKEFQTVINANIQLHRDIINGIAISCPGHIDMRTGEIHTAGAISYLYQFSIKSWLNDLYHLPVSIINDGKAAVLAEWIYGNLKYTKNSAAMVLGTGIGGGLILNNELFYGHHFQSAEFSFILSNNISPQPIVHYGSAVQFMKEAGQMLNVEEHEYQIIFKHIEHKKNKALDELFIKYCHNIAILISNLQVILDLEKIVIGGGISQQKIVIETIKEEYKKQRANIPMLNNTFKPINIEACAYYNQSNLLGAFQFFQTLYLSR